ncbi:hypothetical protein SAMN05421636_11417 [Pricia antarctica]|uniref:Uncharacterized protein n=1 Tax=Pricia antarctica TaxID=641691 RepID=A0A1G7ISY5_9FLAO|nr:hypothetical protein SAMN05421636_11417 [Pricia antarctica]
MALTDIFYKLEDFGLSTVVRRMYVKINELKRQMAYLDYSKYAICSGNSINYNPRNLEF